ncbi:hypothetical protein BDR06DRAFT_948768 [Suillus hirtellus]|nr:hypothetical protein BDR06DRAFT_948768 [Suillus hirtellus]
MNTGAVVQDVQCAHPSLSTKSVGAQAAWYQSIARRNARGPLGTMDTRSGVEF